MTKGKVRKIIKDIHSDEYDPEDKLLAIQEVTEMETHNSVTKADMVEALRWKIDVYAAEK